MSSPAGWSTSSLSNDREASHADVASPHRAPSSPRLTAPLSRAWRGDYAAPLYCRVLGLALAALLLLTAACGGNDDSKGIAISTQAPSRATTPETRTPIGVPPVPPTATTTAPPATVGG